MRCRTCCLACSPRYVPGEHFCRQLTTADVQAAADELMCLAADRAPLVWRDWSKAVPISVEQRDAWAASAMRDPTIIVTRSGDSAVFCVWDGDGEYELFDVIVRRTARFPGNARAWIPAVEVPHADR